MRRKNVPNDVFTHISANERRCRDKLDELTNVKHTVTQKFKTIVARGIVASSDRSVSLKEQSISVSHSAKLQDTY